ncbi:MAG: metalloregulator ArsR/SmtB family transcription factor [Planctomycetota bacterium]
MVIDDQQLDLVFGALADATRRGMLVQLARGEANVSTLMEPYAMSQPAISKHLRVLEKAGLIERRKRGRERFVRVRPDKVDAVAGWISYYAKFWKQQFDAVDDYIKTAKGETQ